MDKDEFARSATIKFKMKIYGKNQKKKAVVRTEPRFVENYSSNTGWNQKFGSNTS